MYKYNSVIRLYSQSDASSALSLVPIVCHTCKSDFTLSARHIVKHHQKRGFIDCHSCINKKLADDNWKKQITPLLVGSMPADKFESRAEFKCTKCEQLYQNTALGVLLKKNKPQFGWCQNCSLAAGHKSRVGMKLGPQTPEQKQASSEKMKQKWLDPSYRKMKQVQIEEQWSDGEFKKRHLLASLAVQEQRERSMKAHHSQPEFKEKQRQDSIGRWNNPEYKANALAHITPGYCARISAAMVEQRNTPEWHKTLSDNAKIAAATSPNYEKFKTQDSEIIERLGTRFEYLGRIPKRRGKSFISVRCTKCNHISDRAIGKCYQQCGACFNSNRSGPEEEIKDFIESLGFARPEKLKQGRKEIDVFVPEKLIGIEYCGLHWHNENSPDPRNKQYHRHKMVAANEAGIRLVTIFEDEWLEREEQVRNVIRAILGKTDTVSARHTKVAVVEKQQAKVFLNKHHIQGGNINFYLAIGLMHNDQLVGLMTFGHHHRGGINVLNRMCFAGGISVIGGASRMLTHATNTLSMLGINSITTWSDNRWSEGAVYGKLGMTMVSELEPGYSYCRRDRRYSKQSLKLTKEEAASGFGEAEIRKAQGFNRIWDCGKKRWKLKW